MGSARKRWVVILSKIREARKVRKISQIQLARLAKIPQSSLSEIETGMAKPSDKNLQKIAEVLGVDIDDLR